MKRKGKPEDPSTKPLDPQELQLRERLALEYQVAEQIRAYRIAFSVGDLPAQARSVKCLSDILWEWMPPEDRKEHDGIKYTELTPADLYTTNDQDIMTMFTLDRKRMKELHHQARLKNMASYEMCCRMQFRVLMRTVKHLGLGFEQVGEESA